MMKVAHLDIRLDNICGKYDGNEFQAVLIDLDRSKCCTRTYAMSGVKIRPGTSVMYKIPDKLWTLDKVDWIQMGIMIFAFLNSITSAKYHQTTPTPHSKFLCSLVEKGEFNDSLYKQW